MSGNRLSWKQGLLEIVADATLDDTSYSPVECWSVPTIALTNSYLTVSLESVTQSGRQAIRVVNSDNLPGTSATKWFLEYTGYQGSVPSPLIWESVALASNVLNHQITEPIPNAYYRFRLVAKEAGSSQYYAEATITTGNDANYNNILQIQQDLIAVAQAASNAQTTADGAIKSFYQTTAPSAGVSSEGDIWFNTADNNKIYTYISNAWVATPDSRIATALANASTAQGTADAKAKIWYQTIAPTGMTAADQGDLWVDTDDNMKVYAYSGSAWVLAQDWMTAKLRADDAWTNAQTALQNAATAQSTADGAIKSFYQTTAPLAGVSGEGDIWFDTDDGNKIYTFISGVWIATPDSRIAQAITAASTAQGTADGKAKVWYQTSAPTGLGIQDQGDLWIDTDDNLKVYAFTGSAWVLAQDYVAAMALLTDIAADNILSKGTEKVSLVSRYNTAIADKDALIKKASALGINSNDLSTAFSALESYLNGLTPAWNTTTVDTPIDKTAFLNTWNTFDTARAKLATSLQGLVQSLNAAVNTNQNISSTAVTSFDGYTVATGNKIMLAGQSTTPSENGIYSVSVSSSQTSGRVFPFGSSLTSSVGTYVNWQNAQDNIPASYATLSSPANGTAIATYNSFFLNANTTGTLTVNLDSVITMDGPTVHVMAYYTLDGINWTLFTNGDMTTNVSSRVLTASINGGVSDLRVKVTASGAWTRIRTWDPDQGIYVFTYAYSTSQALIREVYIDVNTTSSGAVTLTKVADISDGETYLILNGSTYGGKNVTVSRPTPNGTVTLTATDPVFQAKLPVYSSAPVKVLQNSSGTLSWVDPGSGGGTTLNGTGFVKASGTTITYDNSTYLTSLSGHNISELTNNSGYWVGGSALSATTGAFSSDVTLSGSATKNLYIQSNAGNSYLWLNSGNGSYESGIIFQKYGVNQWELYDSTASGNIYLYNYANTKNVLTIAPAGDTTFASDVTTGSAFRVSNSTGGVGQGSMTYNSSLGLAFWAKTGTSNDLTFWNAAGTAAWTMPTGTSNLSVAGTVSASSFSGAGTGLTGTALSLNIGGTAGFAANATNTNYCLANGAFIQRNYSDTQPVVIMNSDGTYYGEIGRSGTQQWGLGWGSGYSIAMTGYALKWNSNGSIYITQDLYCANTAYGIFGNSGRFDTVDSGAAGDQLELCYSVGTGVVVGSGNGTKFLKAGSIYSAGAYSGAITQGSYGSISISGQSNTWGGINFSDYYATLMVNATMQGFYTNNSTWQWRFDNGVLNVGTVPASAISGTIANATTATYANGLKGYSLPSLVGSDVSLIWTGSGWNLAVPNFANTCNTASSATSASYATYLSGPAATNGSDGWFRSSGAAGWYSADYACGIRSIAAGIVRTYNNSSFLSENNITTTNYYYADQNYGSGLVGLYAYTRYRNIYSMGDSYKPALDGTTTGTHYGVGYAYEGYFGVPAGLGHCATFANNGTVQSAVGSAIWTSGNIVAFSDERLKTNWRDLPTDFVEQLSKVKNGIYDRIDGEYTNLTQVGVSAQSLEKVLPNAVIHSGDEQDTLSVAYGNAALSSAIELAKELVKQKAKVEALEKKIVKMSRLLGLDND